MISFIILLIILLIASNFDVFNRMTVPLPIGIVGIVIRTLFILFNDKEHLSECVIAAVILGVLFFIGAIFGSYGGADMMYASMTGLYLGYIGIYAVFIGSIISLPYAVYIKKTKEEKTFPYIPFIFLGVLVMFGAVILGGSIWL